MPGAVARPYAEALLEIAREKGLLDVFREELGFIGEYFRSDPDLHTFFESPRIERAVKRAVLRKAFDGRLNDLIVCFLELLVEKSRQFYLQEIIEAYVELYDEETGRAGVQLLTARPLDSGKAAALRDRLSGILKREVHLDTEVDPGLIGGIVLHVGDTVVDGSIKRKLDELSKKMRDAKLDGAGIYED